MSLSYYKPNSQNKGSAFTFKFGPSAKGGDLKGQLSLYVSAILQATWNAAAKSGTFKENAKNPQKSINIKLTEFEVGGLINAVKKGVEFKGYHTFPGSTGHVQFSFTPSIKEGVVLGFFFSILRDSKDRFAIALSAGECETLIAYFDFGLKTLFANRFRIAQQFQAPEKPVEPPAQEEAQGNPFEQEAVVPTEAGAEEIDENPFG